MMFRKPFLNIHYMWYVILNSQPKPFLQNRLKHSTFAQDLIFVLLRNSRIRPIVLRYKWHSSNRFKYPINVITSLNFGTEHSLQKSGLNHRHSRRCLYSYFKKQQNHADCLRSLKTWFRNRLNILFMVITHFEFRNEQSAEIRLKL